MIDRAKKEVIISCGAVDSPKLLLLSGVGPAQELSKHNISLVSDLPGVGQGLEEHTLCGHVWEEKTGSHSDWSAFQADPENMVKARHDLETAGTGPLASLHTGLVMGFLKEDSLLDDSKAFKELPSHVQDHMRKPTVPLWELVAHTPALHPTADASKSYLTLIAFVQCPLSQGSVTLRSADPKDPPVVALNLLAHPADRAIARAATRQILNFVKVPSVGNDIVEEVSVPKSQSDEDIDDFWRQNCNASYHGSCTVKMGPPDSEMACLDSDFRVKGLQHLRVADLSCTPFLLSCHTQAVAYFIGETAAAKLIEEYGL